VSNRHILCGLAVSIASLLTLAVPEANAGSSHDHSHDHSTSEKAPAIVRPAVIDLLVSKGVVVIDTFAATKDVFGWILESGGKRELLYSTRDRAVFSGDLRAPSGTPLSPLHKVYLSPDQPVSIQTRAWQVASGSTLFSRIGASKKAAVGTPQMIVIFDPACPHCKDLITRLEQMAASGGLLSEVRLLPVAVLSSGSTALVEKFAAEKVAVKLAPGALAGLLKVNQSVMDLAGTASVPIVMYKDADGNPRALAGNPSADVLRAVFAQGAL